MTTAQDRLSNSRHFISTATEDWLIKNKCILYSSRTKGKFLSKADMKVLTPKGTLI